MSPKKDRAFFVCPRWNELASASAPGAGNPAAARINREILAAIAAGRPVAWSTLRKALLTLRATTASRFNVDTYIVDQRAAPDR